MIPIIAMSAKDAREDMDACKEAGMNDYLAKPVELQRYIRCWRNTLRIRCEFFDKTLKLSNAKSEIRLRFLFDIVIIMSERNYTVFCIQFYSVSQE